MALPKGFNSSYEYFLQVNEFLKQNSWIYREANTNFLKADLLKEMPQEYQDYFNQIDVEDLNKFPYVHQELKSLKNEQLIKFRQELKKLIPPEAFKESNVKENNFKQEQFKKMNVKKQHEILRLTAKVKEILKIKEDMKQQEHQYVLIDFGSGLGYLSELLYKLNEKLIVLGLEADTYRVEAAEKRLKTFMPTAINSIHYRQQFITENSKDFINDEVEKVLKLNYNSSTQQQVQEQLTTKMTIIGLHACADLTITSMRLFLQMPQVQQLIIMPCCYHKLQVRDEASSCANSSAAALKFRNFPLSESLKKVFALHITNDKANYEETNEAFTTYLNRPFLRLACQQTLKRWSKCSSSEHHRHGREMFLRAVAEAIKLEKVDEELSIVKRKEEGNCVNSLSGGQIDSFESFSRLYVLKDKKTNKFFEWSEEHRKNFNEIMKQYPKGGKLAEGLTCLQTAMQKLCENLVLYDRLCFMEESALKMDLKIKVRYEKIMDEELSPRCYVLIAEKL